MHFRDQSTNMVISIFCNSTVIENNSKHTNNKIVFKLQKKKNKKQCTVLKNNLKTNIENQSIRIRFFKLNKKSQHIRFSAKRSTHLSNYRLYLNVIRIKVDRNVIKSYSVVKNSSFRLKYTDPYLGHFQTDHQQMAYYIIAVIRH